MEDDVVHISLEDIAIMDASEITVIGRLLSGVHWFSDIVGGILYSAALLSLFCASLSLEERRRNARNARKFSHAVYICQ